MSNGARRAALAALSVVAAALTSLALPLVASAFLPDGRVYEQVSPSNQDGNFIFPRGCCNGGPFRGFAEANGNGIVYEVSGAVEGTMTSGIRQQVVSRRAPGQGWSTSSALPVEQGFIGLISSELPLIDFSRDFSKVVWQSQYNYSPEEPEGPHETMGIFRSSNILEPPLWLSKPQSLTAFPAPGYLTMPNDGTGMNFQLAGISSDASTAYFSYSGTLLPQDEVRRPHVGEGNSRRVEPIAYGFYEWHNGELGEAGELPDGTINPYGAVPAAYGETGERADGDVSRDGTRAYFISPDPYSEQGGGPNCAGCHEAPQLYVREIQPSGERKTVLVSHLELPGQEGKPAAQGVEQFENARGAENNNGSSYVYGSPDGSHAYFATQSRLTSGAPKHTKAHIYMPWEVSGTFTITVSGEGIEQTTGPIAFNAPASEVQSALKGLSALSGATVTATGGPREGGSKAGEWAVEIEGKTLILSGNDEGLAPVQGIYVANENPTYWYDFDSATGKLSYMAGPVGTYHNYSSAGWVPIAVSADGSRGLFLAVGQEKQKLELWTNNEQGGSIEEVAELPPPFYWWERLGVKPAQASADGNAFIFMTSAVFPQFNDGGGHRQIFRYEVSTKRLTCVSCPPAGVSPTGNVEVPMTEGPATDQPNRDISADGTRIFFDTPDPLVGADTNGTRDVYEWESGHIYLITSGTDVKEDSHFFDASESGNDVFFTTEASLVPGDKNASGDVYDARVPQPGDNPPPNAVPCEGDVCQGPPAVPQLLTPAASALFNGLGNIPPEAEAAPPPPSTPKKCAKGQVRTKGQCVRKHKKKAKHSTRRHKSKRRGK